MRLFFFLTFFLLSCSTSKPASPLVAVLNGESITLGDFERFVELEKWKFGEMADAPNEKLLDHFIKNQLLLAEAERRGIQVTSAEVQNKLETFQDHYPKGEDFAQLLSAKGWTREDFAKQQVQELTVQKLAEAVTEGAAQVGEAEVKDYYENHLAEFEHPEQVLARQIVTDSREKSFAVRAMLLKGAPFEETARKYSLSPDRKNGGKLGWFERGVMPKEFDDICFYLKVGELSQVIQTPYGYHLFQVLDKRPAGRFSYPEAREKIEAQLKTEKGRAVFQAWFEKLRSEAKIKVYAEVLKKTQ